MSSRPAEIAGFVHVELVMTRHNYEVARAWAASSELSGPLRATLATLPPGWSEEEVKFGIALQAAVQTMIDNRRKQAPDENF